MLDTGTVVTVCLLCLAAEAFFSGSEIAFIAVNRLKVRVRAEAGRAGAKQLEKMLQTPERILGATLVGTSLAAVTSVTFATLWILDRYEPHYAGLAFLLLPFLVFFGEIVPRSYCQQKAERIAPLVAYPLWLASKILTPVVALVTRTATGISHVLRVPVAATNALAPRDELRLVLQVDPDGGPLGPSELRMIDRIFQFSKTRADEIMIPLIEVRALAETAPVDEAIAEFGRVGFSRMPVFRERVDEIVGIVNAFSLLEAGASDQTIARFVRKPYYAPESKPIDELLFHLQKENQYMAIILDEYGGAVGIVTVEDILEEVVGEIEDEHDRSEAPFRRIDARTLVIKARADVERLNELLKLAIPEGEYETLGGFLLERFGRIPRRGEALRVGSLTFRIEKASERAIHEVRLTVGEGKREV